MEAKVADRQLHSAINGFVGRRAKETEGPGAEADAETREAAGEGDAGDEAQVQEPEAATGVPAPKGEPAAAVQQQTEDGGNGERVQNYLISKI